MGKRRMLTCKHCGQPVHHWYTQNHVRPDDGRPGLSRCDPQVSGLMYGYNADPVGQPCRYPCLGFPETKEDA